VERFYLAIYAIALTCRALSSVDLFKYIIAKRMEELLDINAVK